MHVGLFPSLRTIQASSLVRVGVRGQIEERDDSKGGDGGWFTPNCDGWGKESKHVQERVLARVVAILL